MINFEELNSIFTDSNVKRVLATGHSNIDFDSVGCLSSFSNILTNHYKISCDVVIEGDQVPSNMSLPFKSGSFSFVNGENDIDANNYDLLLVLDCADAYRLPKGVEAISDKLKVVVIDHHESESGFGDVRFVNSEAPSAGILVYYFAKYLNFPMDSDFANAIMVSLYGDTGSFGNSNTDAKVFEIAAEMCRVGANPNEVYRSMFYNTTIKRIRISSMIYETVRQYESGKITLMIADEKKLKNLNATKSDIDGFAESTIKVSGTQIGVYAKIADDYVKFSMRSLPHISVRDVAEIYGGGGHKVAAGCRIDGTDFEAIWSEVLKELTKILV